MQFTPPYMSAAGRTVGDQLRLPGRGRNPDRLVRIFAAGVKDHGGGGKRTDKLIAHFERGPLVVIHSGSQFMVSRALLARSGSITHTLVTGNLDSDQSHPNPQAIVLSAMNQRSHRRLRTQIALLALVALLWSQLALATHPLCVMMAMAPHAVSANAHLDHECPTSGSSQKALCDAHCAQSDLSKDSSRIPPVVPMPLALMPTPWAFVPVRQHHLPVARPWPPTSWNRPTRHPASILLI